MHKLCNSVGVQFDDVPLRILKYEINEFSESEGKSLRLIGLFGSATLKALMKNPILIDLNFGILNPFRSLFLI
jgi:hypothetical protein